MSKLFFYDLETTGTNPGRHGIHQISGEIVIDGKTVETFDFKVQPNPKAQIEDAALEVGGVTREQIMAYPPMGQVYTQLVAMLSKYVDKFDKTDKFHLVGYNNRGFDDNFLRGFFLQNGDKFFGSFFWADSIDVLVLAIDIPCRPPRRIAELQTCDRRRLLGHRHDRRKTSRRIL